MGSLAEELAPHAETAVAPAAHLRRRERAGGSRGLHARSASVGRALRPRGARPETGPDHTALPAGASAPPDAHHAGSRLPRRSAVSARGRRGRARHPGARRARAGRAASSRVDRELFQRRRAEAQLALPLAGRKLQLHTDWGTRDTTDQRVGSVSRRRPKHGSRTTERSIRVVGRVGDPCLEKCRRAAHGTCCTAAMPRECPRARDRVHAGERQLRAAGRGATPRRMTSAFATVAYGASIVSGCARPSDSAEAMADRNAGVASGNGL